MALCGSAACGPVINLAALFVFEHVLTGVRHVYLHPHQFFRITLLDLVSHLGMVHLSRHVDAFYRDMPLTNVLGTDSKM